MLTALLCGVLFSALAVPPGADDEPSNAAALDAAIARWSQCVAGLESIEFRYHSQRTLSPGLMARYGIAKPDIDGVTIYAESAGKFRFDGQCPNVLQGGMLELTSLYDGVKYQGYDPEQDLLAVSSRDVKERSTGCGSNPLWIPNACASDPDTRTYTSTLRDPAYWEKARGRTSWIGVDQVDGHQATVLELRVPRFGKVIVGRVWLAHDLGYYPLKREYRLDDGSLTVVRVESYRVFQHNGHTLVVPMRIVGDAVDSAGQLDSRDVTWIEEDSLRVNQPVPEERFTISPSQVRQFVDMDTGVRIVNKDKGAASVGEAIRRSFEPPPSASASWLRFWPVWAPAAAALALGGAWWRWGRRERAA